MNVKNELFKDGKTVSFQDKTCEKNEQNYIIKMNE